ncbi:hypothetical protein FDP25_00315 [Roseovarius sp. A21]|uniref:Uncharacterized protein n=1 Tax=Roseovarius bejariae TaxID=2576383 RepID=A0A844CF46_9RHOB|nr:hypothetical protein [Roseovarius bejariae]MRU13871.1 hypothetical protein [Roseovarius bejariae]
MALAWNVGVAFSGLFLGSAAFVLTGLLIVGLIFRTGGQVIVVPISSPMTGMSKKGAAKNGGTFVFHRDEGL